MENKDPDLWRYVALCSIVIWFGLGGFVLLVSEGLQWQLAIIFPMIMFGVFFVLLARAILFRPKSIEINDKGIICLMPLGNRKVIEWERIAWISATSDDPSQRPRFFHGSGALGEINQVGAVDLSLENALWIRDEYQKRFGGKVSSVWKVL